MSLMESHPDINDLVAEAIGGHHWMTRRVPDDALCYQPQSAGQ